MRRTKIVAAMLSLVFVFMLFPSLRVSAASTGGCGTDLSYTLDDAGNLTISGTGNKIASGVFSYNASIKTVTLPDSVTSIGFAVFIGCNNLETIEIPKATSIEEQAFSGCTSLKTIEMPEVTSIGVGAFYGCTSLETIEMPKVTSIGYCALRGCTSLTSITMDKSLKEQCDANSVFYGCSSNITITYFEYAITYIDDTNGTVTGTTTTSVSGETIIPTVSPASGYVVKEVTYTNIENTPVPITPDASGNYAFTMPSCNTTVSATFMPGGNCGKNGDNLKWTYDDATKTLTITGSGDMANYAYGGAAPWFGIRDNITSIVISDGVTSIGNWSFYLCQNATSVTIANTVTSIGDEAFYYCKKLNNVNLPASVNTIGTSAFESCSDLSNITIKGTITKLGNGAFAGAALTDIPSNLITSTIPGLTFAECEFTTITIPNTVTSIGDGAFENCYQLTSITIPNSVTSIGGGAFDDCYSLTSITIPNSVTSIGDYAFRNCTNLTSVTIPNSITSIGDDPFFFCDKLKTTDNSISIDKAFYDSNKDAFPDIPLTSFNFTKYAITYTSDGNGTVSGADESASTDKITLTITPNANYVIDTVTYTDNGTEKTINKDANGNYSFDMPVGATTVNATFKLADYEIKFINTDGTVLQSGPVTYGNTPTYTGATPTKAETDKYTYTFAGWKSGNSTYGASSTLPQVTGDVTYTAVFTETAKPTTTVATTPAVTTPAPGTYYVQSIEEKDGAIVITIKRTENDDQTYELVQSIETDGKQLNVGDQIELTSGSAIITIKKDFVSTLTPGTHSMKVTFKDGGSITLEYTVKEPEKAQAAVQATGEAVSAASIAGACLILTAAGIAFTVTRKRKEEA